uniref:Peptidase S54 rhomboid domain-containing protein n=1 Tax=Timema cristinae TaxID=61476 RepID=A0A7R9D2I1_TIMCR|nr:unnamed protein product [Timema cristinae]
MFPSSVRFPRSLYSGGGKCLNEGRTPADKCTCTELCTEIHTESPACSTLCKGGNTDFLYCFSWLHLLFNLVVQVLVGLPLEMVHGSLRIGAVYMAGVLAGSLGTSVFDTDVYLVGASGGVYALLAAHLANVLLNYNNMEFGIVRLIGIFVVASADVGFAVYDRYAAEPMGPPVSYVAHLTGALAGLTIGLLVLKNFEQKLHEQLIWWIALGVYAACTIFAILFNVFNPSYP